jgi:hypothetical protein
VLVEAVAGCFEVVTDVEDLVVASCVKYVVPEFVKCVVSEVVYVKSAL